MNPRPVTPPGRSGGSAFAMQASWLAFFLAGGLGLALLGVWPLGLLGILICLPVFGPPVVAARTPGSAG
jgi:hypothetical protein